MTSTLLNISLINDDVLENNENFFLTINQDSLPTYITTGTTDRTIVNIVDDDRKCFIPKICICKYRWEV